MDPELLRISPVEAAFLALESLIFLVNFIILAYVIRHRHYPPLKVKQVSVVAASLIGSPRSIEVPFFPPLS